MFCGGSPLTNEHIWPRWLSAAMKRHPKGHPGFLVRKGIGSERVDLPSAKEYAITARCVCAKCNNGWMSNLENEARPLIEPMILGDRVKLDPEAQEIVAAWAALRVMAMQQATRGTTTSLPQEWMQHLYETGLAPHSWYVWTGGYNGRSPIAYDLHLVVDPLVMPKGPSEGDRGENGLLASMLVGHLLIKVLAVRRNALGDPPTDYLSRLAPSHGVSLPWPPRRIFDDDSVGAFFSMWLSKTPPIVTDTL